MRVATVVLAGMLMIGAYRAIGFAAWQGGPSSSVPVYGYTVVNTYPHDPNSFTEGLFYQDGFLYESTGIEGRSYFRKTKLETGQVLQQHDIDSRYFGEGIVTWGNDLFELTYTTGLGFVYDKNTFVQKRTFTYQGEGWALTKDTRGLVISDGTDELRFLDPVTLKERRPRLKVTAVGKPPSIQRLTGTGQALKYVNELEIVKGELLANIWQSDYLARINLDTGRVTAWVDLSGLLTPREAAIAEVLNGIAYDELHDRLFVTGKLWPKIFEIRITRK